MERLPTAKQLFDNLLPLDVEISFSYGTASTTVPIRSVALIAFLAVKVGMTVAQTIDTSAGSKTMALDPASHKLYVAAAKPNASGGRGYDPSSFHVLVYGLK